MSVGLRDRMKEFYFWMYTQDIEESQKTRLKSAQDRLRVALELLSKITNNFQNLSKDVLTREISELNSAQFQVILELFRYLTNTSKINFKISFMIWLHQRGITKFALRTFTRQRRKKFALGIRTPANELRGLPGYDRLVNMIAASNSMVKECVDFFLDRNLELNIERIGELQKQGALSIFLNLASAFQERGSTATRRGIAAEQVVREKLSIWGAVPRVHFNLNDLPLADVLLGKLRRISSQTNIDTTQFENHIRKIKSSRQLDLVIPVTDPKLLIQCVFYTSDTGGIAHSTVDQNLLTRRHIDLSLPSRPDHVEFLGFIDGPGWAYLITDLRKTVTGFDDFFQIRSLDSKLRKKLREWRILLPLDIEEAILSTSRGITEANIELVVQELCQLFSMSQDDVLQQLKLFERHAKLRVREDTVQFSVERLNVVKEYYLFDQILSLDFDRTKEGKGIFSVDTPLGPKTIDIDALTQKCEGILTRDEMLQKLNSLISIRSISMKETGSPQ